MSGYTQIMDALQPLGIKLSSRPWYKGVQSYRLFIRRHRYYRQQLQQGNLSSAIYLPALFNSIRISKPSRAAGSLLTQSSIYISLCISKSFALLQRDTLSQFFLKYKKKNNKKDEFKTSASRFFRHKPMLSTYFIYFHFLAHLKNIF